MKNIFYATLILSVITIATACTEKDDFIPEPTPTSVIVSGTVTTTSGKPLANIPIYIDYNISYWLGPQHTLHKAKTTTDSNGRYRLFFEPEKMSEPESDAHKAYFLYADLKELSSKEFITPSDFTENETLTYSYGIYKDLAQGENLELNLHFPKKKEVTTTCKNFIADNILTIRNTILFGVNHESITRTVDLDNSGNGSIIIPCAAAETNKLSLMTGMLEEFESKEILIGNDSDPSIVFDNNEVLENCRFKLSLYDHVSFDGEPYGKNNMLSTPAPFDFLGFRIVTPEGEYDAFGIQRYQYYDSIVWSSAEFPETFKVYEKRHNGSTTADHLLSQWGSYFFDKGFYKTYLKGYKNGRIICSDSITFELKDRDFLCFDWSECTTVSQPDGMHGIYCQLDSYFEYKMTTPIEVDGTKIVTLYVKFRDNWGKDIMLNWQETHLNHFLWKHLGQHRDYDKSHVKDIFRQLPQNDIPGKLYENETTRAIIMHRIPDDEDSGEEECFYIHAESK